MSRTLLAATGSFTGAGFTLNPDGDSRTKAREIPDGLAYFGYGWRWPLHEALPGLHFDGAQTDTQGLQHDGVNSITIADLRPIVQAAVARALATHHTLWVGVPDAVFDVAPATSRDGFRNIMSDYAGGSPRARVLVLQDGPFKTFPGATPRQIARQRGFKAWEMNVGSDEQVALGRGAYFQTISMATLTAALTLDGVHLAQPGAIVVEALVEALLRLWSGTVANDTPRYQQQQALIAACPSLKVGIDFWDPPSSEIGGELASINAFVSGLVASAGAGVRPIAGGGNAEFDGVDNRLVLNGRMLLTSPADAAITIACQIFGAPSTYPVGIRALIDMTASATLSAAIYFDDTKVYVRVAGPVSYEIWSAPFATTTAPTYFTIITSGGAVTGIRVNGVALVVTDVGVTAGTLGESDCIGAIRVGASDFVTWPGTIECILIAQANGGVPAGEITAMETFAAYRTAQT